MPNPNDRPAKNPAPKQDPATPGQPSRPNERKGTNETKREPAQQATPATTRPDAKDPLKTQMPTGEVGVRNKPGVAFASDSGGTSKAEDTSRAAGYVADQTRTNEPPPGPPVEKSPEHFAGQTGENGKKGNRNPQSTPNTTPPKAPADVPREGNRRIDLPPPKLENQGKRETPKPNAPKQEPARKPGAREEAGKVGAALLMWFLGVPGFLVLLYLLFWG